jgi:transcriptional regulator with XRE-family HTH domain
MEYLIIQQPPAASCAIPSEPRRSSAECRSQGAPLSDPGGMGYCAFPGQGEGSPHVTEVQPGGGPTVRRMLVGARLRRLRTEQGISREQAGEAIRASEWKIHRLENGQVGFKERDIVDLLAFYDVTDTGEVEPLLAMARDGNTPGWWHQYGDLLPQWFRAYVDLESAASLIRAYEGQIVPGLPAGTRRRAAVPRPRSAT